MTRIFILLPLLCAACAYQIQRPNLKQHEATAQVLLIDYGYGSELLLERSQNEALLYSYGEWKWYALNQTGWYRVFPVIFWSTPATLARKVLKSPKAFALYQKQWPQHEVYLFKVNAEALENLILKLERLFESHRETLHYNPLYDRYFVKLDRDYHGFHNCNHVTAEWLEELGIDIKGGSPFSLWKIRPSVVEAHVPPSN